MQKINTERKKEKRKAKLDLVCYARKTETVVQVVETCQKGKAKLDLVRSVRKKKHETVIDVVETCKK
jgi:hypothetical protein